MVFFSSNFAQLLEWDKVIVTGKIKRERKIGILVEAACCSRPWFDDLRINLAPPRPRFPWNLQVSDLNFNFGKEERKKEIFLEFLRYKPTTGSLQFRIDISRLNFGATVIFYLLSTIFSVSYLIYFKFFIIYIKIFIIYIKLYKLYKSQSPLCYSNQPIWKVWFK